MAGLATQKFLLPVHAVIGLKHFATTVAVKHIPTALPNLVLVSVGKDLKNLVTYITG